MIENGGNFNLKLKYDQLINQRGGLDNSNNGNDCLSYQVLDLLHTIYLYVFFISSYHIIFILYG